MQSQGVEPRRSCRSQPILVWLPVPPLQQNILILAITDCYELKPAFSIVTFWNSQQHWRRQTVSCMAHSHSPTVVSTGCPSLGPPPSAWQLLLRFCADSLPFLCGFIGISPIPFIFSLLIFCLPSKPTALTPSDAPQAATGLPTDISCLDCPLHPGALPLKAEPTFCGSLRYCSTLQYAKWTPGLPESPSPMSPSLTLVSSIMHYRSRHSNHVTGYSKVSCPSLSSFIPLFRVLLNLSPFPHLCCHQPHPNHQPPLHGN
jgi:hypothetical protein